MSTAVNYNAVPSSMYLFTVHLCVSLHTVASWSCYVHHRRSSSSSIAFAFQHCQFIVHCLRYHATSGYRSDYHRRLSYLVSSSFASHYLFPLYRSFVPSTIDSVVAGIMCRSSFRLVYSIICTLSLTASCWSISLHADKPIAFRLHRSFQSVVFGLINRKS